MNERSARVHRMHSRPLLTVHEKFGRQRIWYESEIPIPMRKERLPHDLYTKSTRDTDPIRAGARL